MKWILIFWIGAVQPFAVEFDDKESCLAAFNRIKIENSNRSVDKNGLYTDKEYLLSGVCVPKGASK